MADVAISTRSLPFPQPPGGVQSVAGFSFKWSCDTQVRWEWDPTSWEREIVIFRAASGPATTVYGRYLSKRSQEYGVADLKTVAPYWWFVIGVHKAGPPNPDLPWKISIPVQAEEAAGSLVLHFDNGAGGRSRLKFVGC